MPDRYIQATCSFRVDGEREIERWDPVTGEMTPVLVYKYENNRYQIPVTLPPEGSAFFVFRKSTGKKHITDIKKDGINMICGNSPLLDGSSETYIREDYVELLGGGKYQFTWNDGKETAINCANIPDQFVLDGNWKIHFMEVPSIEESIDKNIDTLKSWTDFSQPSIKYFSGTARYSKTFNLDNKYSKKGRVYLDLGNVQELATIRLNGIEVSTCWIFPYRADITDYLKNGANLIEIDVTNMWANRLIGDGKLANGERKTKTNIVKFDEPDAEKYLRVSGLLGPVKLQFSQLHEIK